MKDWKIVYELHGKMGSVRVRAADELHAIMEARTVIRDWCNVCHVVSITNR